MLAEAGRVAEPDRLRAQAVGVIRRAAIDLDEPEITQRVALAQVVVARPGRVRSAAKDLRRLAQLPLPVKRHAQDQPRNRVGERILVGELQHVERRGPRRLELGDLEAVHGPQHADLGRNRLGIRVLAAGGARLRGGLDPLARVLEPSPVEREPGTGDAEPRVASSPLARASPRANAPRSPAGRD